MAQATARSQGDVRSSAGLRVGYLVKARPEVGHAFIRPEILSERLTFLSSVPPGAAGTGHGSTPAIARGAVASALHYRRAQAFAGPAASSPRRAGPR